MWVYEGSVVREGCTSNHTLCMMACLVQPLTLVPYKQVVTTTSGKFAV